MKELSALMYALKNPPKQASDAVLITLVSVSGSSYRRPGARMLVFGQERITGTVSGGCLEQDLTLHAQEVAASQKPRLVTYDTTSEDDLLWGLGMGCNGIMTLLLEPLTEDSKLATYFENLQRDQARRWMLTGLSFDAQNTLQAVGRVFDIGGETIAEGAPLPSEFAERCFATPAAPASSPLYAFNELEAPDNWRFFLEAPPLFPQLFILGAGFDALPVARFALELGWRVHIYDHRPANIRADRFPEQVSLACLQPETIAWDHKLKQGGFVVIMTHHFDTDAAHLKQLADQAFTYLGLLGPISRRERLFSLLEKEGTDLTQLKARVHAPIGLDIGGETCEDIALSIISDIQAVFQIRSGGFLKDRKKGIHESD